jgi:ABC-type sugar transport system substrate-binding protein
MFINIKNRRVVIPVALAITTLIVSACGSGSSSVSSAATTAAKAPLSVGIVELQGSSLFTSIQDPAIKAALEKRGWATNFVDPDGSAAAANSAMQNLIQRGVKALVVQTFPVTALVVGMAAAAKAGVPVFGSGGGPAGPGMAGAISSTSASSMNDYSIAYLKDAPRVELLELTYTAGPPCLARQVGMDALLLQHPNIHVTRAPFTFPGANQLTQVATTGWLQSHPSKPGTTYAIWVCTSEGAGGVIAAEKQLKRGPYPLFAWDISSVAIQDIKDGTMTAVVMIPAADGAEQLAQMISDQQAAGSSWVPRTDDAKFRIITKDNLQDATE